MNFWRLILSNPEWVSAFTNGIFAVTTIAVQLGSFAGNDVIDGVANDR